MVLAPGVRTKRATGCACVCAHEKCAYRERSQESRKYQQQHRTEFRNCRTSFRTHLCMFQCVTGVLQWLL
jgi:hypothetical protein